MLLARGAAQQQRAIYTTIRCDITRRASHVYIDRARDERRKVYNIGEGEEAAAKLVGVYGAGQSQLAPFTPSAEFILFAEREREAIENSIYSIHIVKRGSDVLLALFFAA